MNLRSFWIRALGLAVAAGLPVFYAGSLVVSESRGTAAPEFQNLYFFDRHPFPDSSKEARNSQVSVQSLPSGRVLLQYLTAGPEGEPARYFRQSFDGGSTYSPEETIGSHAEMPGEALPSILLLERGIAAVSHHESNIFVRYRADRDRNWSETSQINDQLSSVEGGMNLKQGPGGELYSAWVDDRKGFPLVFFSSSTDGGKSWSANKPVEYDFREGDQRNPRMAVGAGGRLLVFWEDWRDRKTLVDIRYAYSDDGGKHWTPGGKVNDDGLHVWQVDLSVASHGPNIYVAFSDFRDPGEAGDNDWNIYFASSEDNGRSFGKNRRLNDATEGIDKFPSLAVNSSGEVFCAWRSGRNTIFGETAVAYSPDRGRSWSPSVLARSGDSAYIVGVNIVAVTDRSLYVSWREDGYGTQRNVARAVGIASGDAPAPPRAKKPDRPEPVAADKGELLFEENFEDGGANWNEVAGLWLNVNGSYMGTAPGNEKYFLSLAPIAEPESYILEGRFLLDPVAHYLASIYVRAGDSGERNYVISNQFRVGSWMSLKADDTPNGLHQVGGTVLDERRFPLGRNKWYRFRLVVTPAQIDYYVDGRHMLSAMTEGSPGPGSIGLGGYTSSPTYFDDIRIYSIKP